MARENWGEPGNALGKRITIGRDGPWTEVVGVAENIHSDGLSHPAPATVYDRVGVDPPDRPGGSAKVRRAVTFAIRSQRAGTEALVRELAAAIHSVSPDLPLAKVRTLEHVYRQSTAQTSFAIVLLGISGTMALTLAIIGVYGVLAYAVAQRRHEIGIRIALGAEPAALKWLVIRKGLLLNCIGGIIGVAAALVLSRWIVALLYGVTPRDLPTYAVSGALMVAAVMAASYFPARRATVLIQWRHSAANKDRQSVDPAGFTRQARSIYAL